MHVDSKCVNKDYASIMYRIRTSAQTFTSADQTENYDSDDSVTCGEKFAAITARVVQKHWESLSEFLNLRNFFET